MEGYQAVGKTYPAILRQWMAIMHLTDFDTVNLLLHAIADVRIIIVEADNLS